VRRQRFGDGNQAIYDLVGTREATTDKFPSDSNKKNLPNSYRFGQRIAELADPLGIVPYGLRGSGPQHDVLASGKDDAPHTIFLFTEESAGRILDAYAKLLIKTFSEQELHRGGFTAVGQVHRHKGQEDESKFPSHVGNYWPEYDPEVSRSNRTSGTFVQYVFAGQAAARAAGESYPAVEKITAGLLRLATMPDTAAANRPRKYGHRYITELLEEQSEIGSLYTDLLTQLAAKRETLTKALWESELSATVRRISEAMAGMDVSGTEVDGFLAWEDATEAHQERNRSRDNIYRAVNDGVEVAIRVGSIHSVKGETHAATLVLETFWHKHNLRSIKGWLCGDKLGLGEEGPRIKERLKLHYVAMTRPSHLLCLAMKRSAFENAQSELDRAAIKKLEDRGWQVELI